MKLAFIMDPLEKVNPAKDTTYYIMLAARQQSHRVFYANQTDMYMLDSRVRARAAEVDVHEDLQKPFSVSPMEDMSLEEMDVVMIRTDPPFDRRYFYATLLLDMLPPTTRVFNRPSGLRNWNEKLAATLFPNLTPPTLVTRDAEQIRDFMNRSGRITLKPIDGFAGKGIVFLKPESENSDQLIDMVTHGGRHWVIAQKYLTAATEGDKRILLMNGKPMGGILRLHPEGKELNNLDAGGSAHPSELTERDLEICKALEQPLVDEGVYFAGIDIIGGMLIEVNVTSPTGLQQLCQFSGVPYHHHLVEGMVR